MSEKLGQITAVKINNQEYHVRSGGNPEYVKMLADHVDQKIREISDRTPTVDSLKVAILAALNIADEYFSAKEKLDELERNVSHKTAGMLSMLEPFVRSKSG
ncbi:MAG: cell division protein ZapA [Acidobacteriota bacterium]